MAKKTTAKRSSAPAKKAPAAKRAEPDVDQSPELQQAANAVCKAQAEFEKAQELYRQVRQEATDRLRQVREKTVGDLIDDTFAAVRKHPGPGVVIAGLVGFFLGRWLGRLFRR